MLRPSGMASPRASILTTHTGSLPRPPELSELMLKRDAGQFDDEASLRQQIARATAEVVRRQREAGIDILNDGEYSKVSYSGYVKERLSGFDGEPRKRSVVDPEFPDWQRPTPSLVRYPTNNGPVELRDPGGVRRDIANLQAAIASTGVSRGKVFMSAASPGVIDTFMPSTYYASEEEYVRAVGAAMRGWAGGPDARAGRFSWPHVRSLSGAEVARTWPCPIGWLPRRPVLRTLRLAQGLNPLLAAQQLGGPGRLDRTAGGNGHRDAGRGGVISCLVDDQHVILAERIAAHQDLGPHGLEPRPDCLDPVVRLLDLSR